VRIAIVTTSYPAFRGDPCGHFVETEAGRRAAHDEVFVVTAEHRHDGELRREDARFSVLRLEGYDAFGWPGLASRVRARPHLLLGAARWARRARAALLSLAPLHRIVAHWAVPCGWPISTGLGAPVELVSHGADVRALVSCPASLRHAILERLLRDADAWRFVSASLLERLTSSLDGVDARRLSRIARVEACPIDVPDIQRAADEKRARHAGVRLAVCVARLVPKKRVDRVIEHVAAVAGAERPTRLVVVGDGPLLASLEEQARALGVDALFVGQTTRPEALAWIGAAEVVLHASEAEGLSTVEREAKALGVPFRYLGPNAGVCVGVDLR
jgi:teichuronic acid biosynthesis glycosyltransferase TuaC